MSFSFCVAQLPANEYNNISWKLEINMKFTKDDIAQGKNLLKAISKGKWDLDGMEILAFGNMFRWFGNLQQKIEAELLEEEAIEKEKVEEQKRLNDGRLIPKPVENITKPIDTPAVKSKTKK